jgi:hypothetical protein
MSLPRKKLTLQLTPLLDLLLIVIFAQYMDVRQTEARQAGRSVVREEELTAATDEARRLALELANMHALIVEAQQAVQATQGIVESTRAAQHRQQAELDRSTARQQLLGRLIVELFDVPDDVVAMALNPSRNPPLADSPLEFEELRSRFEELASANSGKVVRHLLTYEEIRKRCDVWELHYAAGPPGEIVVTVRGDERRLAVPLTRGAGTPVANVPQFERDVSTLLESLPQPKGLVIVVMTNDPLVPDSMLFDIKEGVGKVLSRLRLESAGRTQIEFADLGVVLPE